MACVLHVTCVVRFAYRIVVDGLFNCTICNWVYSLSEIFLERIEFRIKYSSLIIDYLAELFTFIIIASTMLFRSTSRAWRESTFDSRLLIFCGRLGKTLRKPTIPTSLDSIDSCWEVIALSTVSQIELEYVTIDDIMVPFFTTNTKLDDWCCALMKMTWQWFQVYLPSDARKSMGVNVPIRERDSWTQLELDESLRWFMISISLVALLLPLLFLLLLLMLLLLLLQLFILLLLLLFFLCRVSLLLLFLSIFITDVLGTRFDEALTVTLLWLAPLWWQPGEQASKHGRKFGSCSCELHYAFFAVECFRFAESSQLLQILHMYSVTGSLLVDLGIMVIGRHMSWNDFVHL